MANLFTTILNMSLTACIIILIVLLARQCLKKVPKIFSYVLWGVVLFRLLCPVSISLPVSILAPMSGASTSAGTSYTASMEYISVPERNESEQTQQPVPGENGTQGNATGADADVSTVPLSPIAPETATPPAVVEQKMSAGEIVLTVLGWVWVAGMVGVLGMTAWQTISLKRRLADACIVRGNIFESDKIDTAFVLGVINPKIYLPLGLPFDVQKAVVAHEQTHQRRGDHIVKLVSYIALAIHWFNPLVWLSFKLMCDDMEKSCDEAVVRTMNGRGYTVKSVKKAYSNMLFFLGSGKQHIFSPVSFAEHSTKERIINVAQYKKLTQKASIIFAIACVLLIGLCLINPKAVSASSENAPSQEIVHSQDAVQLTIGDITFWSDATEIDFTKSDNPHAITDISLLSECSNLQKVNLSYTSVSDLSPLLACKNLKELLLERNDNITNISMVSEFKKLQNLNIVGTETDDISFLANMTNLKGVSYDVDSADDIIYLDGFKDLEYLYLYMPAELPDLSYLENLKKLQHLTIICLYGMQDISALSSLEYLKTLDLYGNFTDISVLSNFSDLESLSLKGRFTNISAISSCTELKKISLNAHFTKVEALSNCTKLESVELYGAYDDISPLKSCTQITEISLLGEFADVDAINSMKAVNYVSLTSEYLTDLSGLTGLQNIITLYIHNATMCDFLSIQSLPVSTLGLANMKISDIDFIADIDTLTSLSINGCPISDITPLTKLPDLSRFYLCRTDVSDISPLYEINNIKYLWLEDNKIPQNDISDYLDQHPDCIFDFNI